MKYKGVLYFIIKGKVFYSYENYIYIVRIFILVILNFIDRYLMLSILYMYENYISLIINI